MRVERVVDVQEPDKLALTLQPLGGPQQRFGVPGQGHQVWAIDGADMEPVGFVRDQLPAWASRNACGQHPPFTRHLVLQSAAVVDDCHRVIKGIDTGTIDSGHLSDTVADGLGRFDPPRSPQLDQRHLEGENRRLSDVRFENTRLVVGRFISSITDGPPSATSRRSISSIVCRKIGSRRSNCRPMPFRCAPCPVKTKTGGWVGPAARPTTIPSVATGFCRQSRRRLRNSSALCAMTARRSMWCSLRCPAV